MFFFSMQGAIKRRRVWKQKKGLLGREESKRVGVEEIFEERTKARGREKKSKKLNKAF